MEFLTGSGWEILSFGSMNYIEREVEGLRPDVAMIAAARQRLEIYDYTGLLMRALGLPRVVFATHWDEQSFPFGAPQNERLREAEIFVREVKKVSPGKCPGRGPRGRAMTKSAFAAPTFMMGGSYFAHFNAFQKERLGWLRKLVP
jgi:hypothetical protein